MPLDPRDFRLDSAAPANGAHQPRDWAADGPRLLETLHTVRRVIAQDPSPNAQQAARLIDQATAEAAQ